MRWEYQTVQVKFKVNFWTSAAHPEQQLQAVLGPMGLQGWELVSSVSPYSSQQATLIFKRPAAAQEGDWPPPPG
jgi:hypothetical protein